MNKDFAVKAVRKDEMVLYKKLFDTLIYKSKRRDVIREPLKEKQGYPDGFFVKTADGSDLVGLLNTGEQYGFFSLRIGYANSCCGTSGNWMHKPGTYFYAPSNG